MIVRMSRALSKVDYVAACVASLGFMLGAVLGAWFVGAVIEIVWAHGKTGVDGGLLYAPFIIIAGIVGAWYGVYWALRLFGRKAGQQYVTETYQLFSLFVFLAFVVTIAAGAISSRAYVTVPALLVSLAGAYTLARLIVLKRH